MKKKKQTTTKASFANIIINNTYDISILIIIDIYDSNNV